MKSSEFQHIVSEKNSSMESPGGVRVDKVRRLFAELKERKIVLDVGCAHGAILLPFISQHEIHGVDISESLVKLANERGTKAVKHDLESGPLPYPDKSFDVIFCGETIEHQVDTDWLLAELNRVLRPNGTLILTFPNIRTVLGLAMLMFLDLPPMYAARYKASHVRDFTLKTIRMALRARGFEPVQSIGSAFYFPRIGEFGSSLATYLPSWSHTVIVVASKVRDSAYSSEELINTELY